MEQIKISMLDDIFGNESLRGLTSLQAKTRLKLYGENKFTKEKVSGWNVFLKQFINPLSFILTFAAGISVFMGEYVDAGMIIIIVVLNSSLSFVQEFRSEKAVKMLSDLIERKSLVIRDDEQIMINASQIVPGDIVVLKHGDVVPADAKIIKSYDLLVNESQLTGESIPIAKKNGLSGIGENLLYTGSVIEKGHCHCSVFATGFQSQLGKIAQLSKDTKKETPYQKSLSQFSRSLLRIIGTAIVFMLAVKSLTIANSEGFAEVLIFAIALAMTVVPEALPMVTTINLSHGALRLAKQNVVAKRLSAIEDLGRINLLCTDKTGTLTEDRLALASIMSDDELLFQKLAILCLENYPLTDQQEMNSFDFAFVKYIPRSVQVLVRDWQRLLSVPFDPALRRRRVIVSDPVVDKRYLVVVGAPEILLELSDSNLIEQYQAALAESGKQGMRQLGIAYKEIDYTSDFDLLANEKDLTFLGFAKLYDPLRKTAKATVLRARTLGVDVKILSGDSPEVVGFIGQEIGLTIAGDPIYTGDELDQMTDLQFDEALEQCCVFARVTPEQKYKMIKHLKQHFVVGYQGDGINDAPSLKLADVSVAVHNATDVAKDSADIVLLKDDLGVIINAIQYGRSIFVNINKYIKHAMIGNLGNFFSMIIFYLIFAADIPMLAIQLLVGNIIQDMPLMTVYSDGVDESEVNQPQAATQINSMMKVSLALGAFTCVYYLLFFLYTGRESTPLTQSTLFLFYNFTQLLVIISIRNKNCFFWQAVKPSCLLLCTIGIFMVVSIALVYVPATAAMMGFVALPLSNFMILVGISIAYLFFLDLVKVMLYRWLLK